MISDSSFRGEEDDALAMRSGVIALSDRGGPHVGQNGLQVPSSLLRSVWVSQYHKLSHDRGSVGS